MDAFTHLLATRPVLFLHLSTAIGAFALGAASWNARAWLGHPGIENGAPADLVVFAVGRYGQELTSVITATIARWDGEEAARKIELHVGRDLQFIRINGTIVGGLVGVLIHAVTVLLK